MLGDEKRGNDEGREEGVKARKREIEGKNGGERGVRRR